MASHDNNGNSRSSLLEQRPDYAGPDYLVCTCMGVMYQEIVEQIKNGCNTFEKLSDVLMVGTGCSSCVPEIEQMLRKYALK